MILLWVIIGIMIVIALGFVLVPLITQPKKWLTIGMLAVIFPVAMVGLYIYWGHSQQLAHYYQDQRETKLVQKTIKKLGSVNAIIAKFKHYQKQHLSDPKAWYLLGKLYASQGQFKQAKQAFAHAHQLKPEKFTYSVAYLESSYFAAKRQFSPGMEKLLQQLYHQQPNDPNLINLVALAAYQHKHYQRAIKLWESLLPLFANGTHDKQALLMMIAKAERLLTAK